MFFAEKIEKVPERMQTSELSETLCRFRTAWKKMLYRGMDEKHAATVAAILLGEKSGMDPDVKEEFQLGGIGHILAISSLHMSLLGIGLYQFLRKRGASLLECGTGGQFFSGTLRVDGWDRSLDDQSAGDVSGENRSRDHGTHL